MSKQIEKEIKEEILDRIKDQGLSAPDASTQYGIRKRTIYDWLSKAGISSSNNHKLQKLTNENERLYAIIGRLSTELNRLKRGRSCK